MGAPVTRPRGDAGDDDIVAVSTQVVTLPESVVTPSPSCSPPPPLALPRNATVTAKDAATSSLSKSKGGRRPTSAVPSPATSSAAADATTPAATGACESCGTAHDRTYGSGRFCSVHCARRVAAGRKWANQRNAQKRAVEAEAVARKRRRSGSGGAVPLLPLPPFMPMASPHAAAVAAAAAHVAHSAHSARAAAAAAAAAVSPVAATPVPACSSVGVQLRCAPPPAVLPSSTGPSAARVLLPAPAHMAGLPAEAFCPYSPVFSQGVLMSPAFYRRPVRGGVGEEGRGMPLQQSAASPLLPPPRRPSSSHPSPPPPARSTRPRAFPEAPAASHALLPLAVAKPTVPVPVAHAPLPVPAAKARVPSPPVAKTKRSAPQSTPPPRRPRVRAAAATGTGDGREVATSAPAGVAVATSFVQPVRVAASRSSAVQRSPAVQPPAMTGGDADCDGAAAGLAAEALLRLSRHRVVGVPAS
ncbi:hypothetical protein BU14_1466s0002 [Porphyra umbilicalis]|uniref:FCS-type domain-containing protein n=1 Tax=Porphyra umbilicalis TaxID=2786 RepID=A0A1X6NLJ7_PORUM|nr:hypothetical protein BU14_1466s0002 [Porphyra umbilicalis]|eukprot:OSX69484.1 hypothetical protein BU14_1466s0002 [Porphyra umbilicalis]